MGKSAKTLPFSPTSPTKPGEKLKGRKRPKSVMEKAWETRRAKAGKRAGAATWAKKAGPKKPTRKTAKQSVATILRSEGFKTERRKRQAVTTRPSEVFKVETRTVGGGGGSGSATMASPGHHAGHDPITTATKAIMVEARKKDAELAICRRLTTMVALARHEAEQDEQHRSSREIAEIGKLTVERIVCGFIAEVEMAMTLHRGLPVDMVWNLSSYTVAKVLDALNEAGYTAKGRKPRPVKGDYENF